MPKYTHDFVNEAMEATAAMPREAGSYEIREGSYPYRGQIVEIRVQGVDSLPYALERLAEMGHDMALSLEVLQKAVEEQRRRKALDAAINDLR